MGITFYITFYSSTRHDPEVPVAPERSLGQRMDALTLANEVRIPRADVRRDIRAGRVSLAAVLLDPPACVRGAKVAALLPCIPKVGSAKAKRALKVCGISPAKTVSGLSDQQRAALVGWIARLPSASHRRSGPVGPAPPTGGGTDPASQHMRALAVANATRLAAAALKREIAASKVTVVEILRDAPPEARILTISALLGSQHRWGQQRADALLDRSGISHDRLVGEMTQRQRLVVADLLEERPAPSSERGANVLRSRPGRLHLVADDSHSPVCGSDGAGYSWVKAAEWNAPAALRCSMCVTSSVKRSLVPHD